MCPDEGSVKAMTAAAFSTALLEPRKVVAFATISAEVARAANDVQAGQCRAGELRKAAVRALDKAFINPASAGSVTNGITPIARSGGFAARQFL